MTDKDPKKVITSYKTFCEKKITKVEDFLAKHAELNKDQGLKLKKLCEDLENQYQRMESEWQKLMADVTTEVFDALDKIVQETDTQVTKLLETAEEAVDKSTTGSASASAARPRTVEIKLPTFWTTGIALWFAQAEAKFASNSVVEETIKYDHLVAALDHATAMQVMDLVETPPDVDAYTTLKARLTELFKITDPEKAAKILDSSGMGDSSPSRLLGSMLLLVPREEQPGFLFKELFLRRLPTEVRSLLAQTRHTGTKAADLRELAKEADKLFTSDGSRISSVSYNTNYDTGETEINAIAPRRNQNNGPSRRNQNPHRQGQQRSFTFCFYHSRFLDKATRCANPCDWNKRLEPALGNGPAGRRSTMSQ